MDLNQEVSKRRTFAIISHPDAGKTTVTEKLLLYGGAIQTAGAVKSKKNQNAATSDWMKMEQERGISVASSVMQFPYKDVIINLLDTPGHEDFSEDTYRVLSAVDSALMIIDAAKGVEARTLKLMEVCRLRSIPILTFINKFDRDTKDTFELLDEIETKLNIRTSPITWPIGSGSSFKGTFNFLTKKVSLFDKSIKDKRQELNFVAFDSPEIKSIDFIDDITEQINLASELLPKFNLEEFLTGQLSPVFFGSAINSFGLPELLDGFIDYAPSPSSYEAINTDSNKTLEIMAKDENLRGFVFKIQANMDPKHRDRIAFIRLVSGALTEGAKIYQNRLNKEIKLTKTLNFLASDRVITKEAVAGDIIGIYNHGSIRIGDTFCQKKEEKDLKFTGIPNFASEIFRKVILKDPLKAKALHKGLNELSEEGATQVFRPLNNNNIILGAVGVLQFEVVAQRLLDEYKVQLIFEASEIKLSPWIINDGGLQEAKLNKTLDENQDYTPLSKSEFERFMQKYSTSLALDSKENLVFLAASNASLTLAKQKNPELSFVKFYEN